MQTVILAAGKSTRNGGQPKAITVYNNLPLIDHIILSLDDIARPGEIYIVTSRGDAGSHYIQRAITFVALSTGTATALDALRDFLGDDAFLVLPSDTLYHPDDIRRVAESPADVALAYTLGARSGESSLVFSNGRIIGIREKGDMPASAFKSVMLYKLPRRIFDYLPGELSPRGEYELQGAINAMLLHGNDTVTKVEGIKIGPYKHFTTPDDFRRHENEPN